MWLHLVWDGAEARYGLQRGHQPPAAGTDRDRDPCLTWGSAGSCPLAAACPEHEAGQADTALNHTLPTGITQGIYPNIDHY